MENSKIQITKKEKLAYIEDYKSIFKFINKSLSNVILEYQLEDLLLTTNKFSSKNKFDEFVAESIRLQLMKKEELGNKEVLVLKDFVIKNISKKKQYKYSIVDAKTSYYKMFFILEVAKSRDIDYVQDFETIERVYNNHSTFSIEKSKTYELYKTLESKNFLNQNGKIRLNDLELYEKNKLFNLKSSKNAKSITIIDEIEKDAVLLEKIKNKKLEIDNNSNFHIYNLAKVSDNKSYFLFFNLQNREGYKKIKDNCVNIVKFDVSQNFKTAELGDYIARVLESIRLHLSENRKNIYIEIYYTNEKEKESAFIHSVNYKTARNGVRNLDSNLTARIKEVMRSVFHTKIINFVNLRIDYSAFTASYRVYFNSKQSDVDDFYTLTLSFKNANLENDIYDKDYEEKKRIEKERKQKEKQVEKYANDEEFMSLLFEYLSSRKN